MDGGGWVRNCNVEDEYGVVKRVGFFVDEVCVYIDCK